MEPLIPLYELKYIPPACCSNRAQLPLAVQSVRRPMWEMSHPPRPANPIAAAARIPRGVGARRARPAGVEWVSDPSAAAPRPVAAVVVAGTAR